MNPEQEKRVQIVHNIKARIRLNPIPQFHSYVIRALDAWSCEPVWKRQIKFWRFVAVMELTVLLFLWGLK